MFSAIFVTFIVVCLCSLVCMLTMRLCVLPAICLFGGRELVEGDQKAVRDASGRCLLFECRVGSVITHTHTHADKRTLCTLVQKRFNQSLRNHAAITQASELFTSIIPHVGVPDSSLNIILPTNFGRTCQEKLPPQ